MCGLFAATYPDRTLALIMYGSYARRQRSADYPWGRPYDLEGLTPGDRREPGGPVGRAARAPGAAHDERSMNFSASYLVQSAAHAALTRPGSNAEIDVRPVLPVIHADPDPPIARRQDRPNREARYLAEQSRERGLVLLDGEDHLPWIEINTVLDEDLEESLTGVRARPRLEQVLATVLFTDIVDSTKKAAKLGARIEGVAPRARRACPCQSLLGTEESRSNDGDGSWRPSTTRPASVAPRPSPWTCGT